MVSLFSLRDKRLNQRLERLVEGVKDKRETSLLVGGICRENLVEAVVLVSKMRQINRKR